MDQKLTQVRNLIAKHGNHPRAHALYLAGLVAAAGHSQAVLDAASDPGTAADVINRLVDESKQKAEAPAAAEATAKLAAAEKDRQKAVAEKETLQQRVDQLEAENRSLVDTIQELAEAEADQPSGDPPAVDETPVADEAPTPEPAAPEDAPAEEVAQDEPAPKKRSRKKKTKVSEDF